jgi:rhodanese-related sulfurtransferase
MLNFIKNLFAKKYEEVNAQEFARLMNDGSHVVIDVRSVAEFKSGHIEKARNIDVMSGSFTDKASHLDTNKTYLLYCRSGRRSALACSKMAAKGYKVLNLKGGILSWTGKVVK